LDWKKALIDLFQAIVSKDFAIKKLIGVVFGYLKGLLKKLVLSKILGIAIGGIKGFFVKLAFDIIWKKLIRPLKNGLVYLAEMALVKIKVKKNSDAYHDAETKEERDDAYENLP